MICEVHLLWMHDNNGIVLAYIAGCLYLAVASNVAKCGKFVGQNNFLQRLVVGAFLAILYACMLPFQKQLNNDFSVT